MRRVIGVKLRDHEVELWERRGVYYLYLDEEEVERCSELREALDRFDEVVLQLWRGEEEVDEG